MTEIKEVADAAKRIYETLRASLEVSNMNEFVSIEPVSREYFVGKSMSEAVAAARSKYPGRLVHTFRVGHKAAIHFGMQSR